MDLAWSRDAVETLLKNGADLHASSPKTGRTALHYSRNVSGAEALIDAGASIDAVDFAGRTPLHYAGDVRIAKALVSHGADHLAVDLEGKTPLHFNRNEDVLQFLLSLPRSEEIAEAAAAESEALREILAEGEGERD